MDRPEEKASRFCDSSKRRKDMYIGVPTGDTTRLRELKNALHMR